MIDGKRQSKFETRLEDLVNPNIVSFVNLIALLKNSSGFSEDMLLGCCCLIVVRGMLLQCCCLMVVCGIDGVNDSFLSILTSC